MNLIDLFLILIFLLSLWAGWIRGFIYGAVDLLIWIGSIIGALLLHVRVGGLLNHIFPALGVWALPLAFIATLFLLRIFLSLLFHKIFYPSTQGVQATTINRVMGFIPGAAMGLIYTTIAVAFLISFPFSNSIGDEVRQSKIAGRLTPEVAWINNKFSPVFEPALKEGIRKPVTEKEGETIPLNYTVKKAEKRPDLETQMLVLVNEERQKNNLSPLKWDTALTRVARLHSADMFARGYFSHYTPEHHDPFFRMKQAGVKFTTAGENLALGQSLKICHEGLMNSPGHRANILNPAYGRLGIGILDGGIYGLMISQEFRN